MTKDFEPMDTVLPNVIILERSQDACKEWRKISAKYPKLNFYITDNPDEALFEWINLFSHDFIPRSIVCRRTIEKQSMGLTYAKTDNGTEVAIDGSEFVLYQCMQAVGDAPGMFCLYTDSADEAQGSLKSWDTNGRVHVLPMGACDNQFEPCGVIDYIINHDEYIAQCMSMRSP